jgi:DNA (cytosine-5)-methyltransferase 1
VGHDLHPLPVGVVVPLKAVAPDVIACRSQGINPWIESNRPCCTVTKTLYEKMFRTRDGSVRCPDERELKLLSSFPEGFRFVGSFRNRAARMGNCVPPLLMFSIASRIRERLKGGRSMLDFSKPYPEFLEDAWALHKAPRAPDAPTVISTFAGCGGSSLGYSMAGFRELLAVEWEDNAAETFRINFPEIQLFHGDIAKISVQEALDRAKLQPGQLDVFDGSPPCQGFSTAGKREFVDDRNQLFREYVRLLRGLNPKAFVMENVSGMVKGGMKLIFAEIMKELKASGYDVVAKLLNASWYGVPQARERMIFIGVRRDDGKRPEHPEPISRIVPCDEAVEGVPNDEAERQMLLDAGARYAAYAYWSRTPLGGSADDIEGVGKLYTAIRVHPKKPCPTITKSVGTVSVGQLMHWAERRRFTTAEMRRLSSFPDGFSFPGGFEKAAQRMGNCVPPLLMRAVACSVQKTLSR